MLKVGPATAGTAAGAPETGAFETLEARGLDVELAAKLGWSADGGKLTIPFIRNGLTVRNKYRTFAPKKFWQDKSQVRLCWNEDALSLPGNLIVTEGELDALSAIQAGYAKTVSVPDGAPNEGERDEEEIRAGTKHAWIEAVSDKLKREHTPEIIIAADGDNNGAALLHELSLILGRFRCKFVTYPKSKKDRGRERCKDLNEVLEDYGVAGVRATIERAAFVALPGVFRMSELPPLPDPVMFEPRFVLFRENFKVRLGDFSVVTGTPGFGKSTFVNDLFCGVAVDNDLTVAWASFEQEPQRDHRRNLRSWFCQAPDWQLDADSRAGADRWIDERHVFIVPSEDDDCDLDWLLDAMEGATHRHDAKIFVIDPWNEIEHCRRRDESETEYIGRAIRKLKRFAKTFKVHVCVVAHPTKSVKGEDGNYKMPSLYDIAGSANWYNKADLGIIVHRDMDETYGEVTRIKTQKSRYHEVIGKPGEVLMALNKDERRYTELERSA